MCEILIQNANLYKLFINPDPLQMFALTYPSLSQQNTAKPALFPCRFIYNVCFGVFLHFLCSVTIEALFLMLKNYIMHKVLVLVLYNFICKAASWKLNVNQKHSFPLNIYKPLKMCDTSLTFRHRFFQSRKACLRDVAARLVSILKISVIDYPAGN